MTLTEREMREISDREKKARSILKGITEIFAMGSGENIDVLDLVESALDYLNENEKYFSAGL
ncbi:MAG: hypothetical protein LUG49_05895 [Oscillospiraceae bacterium]|nr:hypothetical protein [Oscillospiraceae bacterium]